MLLNGSSARQLPALRVGASDSPRRTCLEPQGVSGVTFSGLGAGLSPNPPRTKASACWAEPILPQGNRPLSCSSTDEAGQRNPQAAGSHHPRSGGKS